MKDINQVVIYESSDGKTHLEVRLENESIWLTQKQMAELFEKNIMTVNEHIKNVYSEGELSEDSTIRKSLIVQTEGKREVKREVSIYNLDVLISVGYRVKSKSGTQFRIWANRILKDYLIKGYSINEKTLRETKQQLVDLKSTVKLLESVSANTVLTSDEAQGLLKVITDYTYALDILDKYDHEQLEIEHISKKELFKIDYDEAIGAIETLKKTFGGGDLFGLEKDESFKSSISTIYQTFGDKDLYPSLEEKASHLLYFVVKNHSFTDGNKRIAAFMFVWFLERNHLLYNENGQKRLADNALVALTLMIAESRADQKDTIVKVVVNLINKNN